MQMLWSLVSPLHCFSLLLLVWNGTCYQGILQFRSATKEDIAIARKILVQQAMNPLGISEETLLVAYDSDTETNDDNNNNNDILGFGQIRALNEEYSELASLYVRPEYRKQGIGTAIVETLLERHTTNNDNPNCVCLLTLKPTQKFYEPHGFQIVSTKQLQELPTSIQLEYKAGQAISVFLGNNIICMVQQ